MPVGFYGTSHHAVEDLGIMRTIADLTVVCATDADHLRGVLRASAGSLVPTTLAGHRFWEADDRSQRDAQLTPFTKNAAMLGGLLAAALDTGGRPSVWSGRRVAGQAAHSVADTTSAAYRTLPGVS